MDGGQLRGQEEAGAGWALPLPPSLASPASALSLAGATEPQGPPRCTCVPVEQGGRRGLSSSTAVGWPRRAR